MTTAVEWMHNRALITDLVHGYAFNIRNGRAEACVDLFTPDAEFEVREADGSVSGGYSTRSRLVGREAVLAYIIKASAAEFIVCPLIHNLFIELDGGIAQSSCLMTSHTWPAGQETVGEYRDSYRHDHGWRFTRRIFTMFGKSGPVRSETL